MHRTSSPIKTRSWNSTLLTYQQTINGEISSILQAASVQNELRKACEYALNTGGKMLRPAIVIMVANALDPSRNALKAAAAIEFFHTASLIIDDLPCMDNDDERRKKPSLHKAYSEMIALLSTYALIALGYESIAKNARELVADGSVNQNEAGVISLMAIESVSHNAGFRGATAGQLLDLYPPDTSPVTLQAIFKLKTISLFEIAFTLGWLFGGGDKGSIEKIKELAYHYGMAFQLADDLDDLCQDQCKATGINYAAIHGLDKTVTLLDESSTRYKALLLDLGLATADLCAIADLLMPKAES